MKRWWMFVLVLFSACIPGADDNACIGNDCVCAVEECNATCDAALGDCDIACNNSDCNADCDGSVTCDIQGGNIVEADCSGVTQCDVECSAASSCTVDCTDASCDVTCPALGCIVQNCTQGATCNVACGFGGVGVQQGADVVCQ